MNHPTLRGGHGLQGHDTALTLSTTSSAQCNFYHLLPTPVLVALNINHNGVTSPCLLGDDRSRHGLKRLERTPVSSDDKGEVRPDQVENQLALVALILLNLEVRNAAVANDGSEYFCGTICNLVDLIIGQFIVMYFRYRL